MIIVVKKKNIKKVVVKALVLVFLVGMFGAYYIHMSDLFGNMGKKEEPKIVKKIELTEEEKLAIKLEKILYKEAEDIIDLLEQKNIQKIYVTKKNLLIRCDTTTNLEPLLVRYGVKIQYKHGIDYTTINVDLGFIVDENFEYES